MERRHFLALLSVAAALPPAKIRGKRHIEIEDVARAEAELPHSRHIPNVSFRVDGHDLSDDLREIHIENQLENVTRFGDQWESYAPSGAVVVTADLIDSVEDWIPPMGRALRVEIAHGGTGFSWLGQGFVTRYNRRLLRNALGEVEMTIRVSGGMILVADDPRANG